MTKLIAAWGALGVVVFVCFYPPTGFLFGGLFFLTLAALRSLNETSTKGARR